MKKLLIISLLFLSVAAQAQNLVTEPVVEPEKVEGVQELGIEQQVDYEKFYLYSLITHSWNPWLRV